MGLSNEEKVKLLRLIESYAMYHDMAKTSFEKAITSLINFENQQKNIPWDSWNINKKGYNMHNAKSLSNVVSPDILNAYSQLHLFINKVSVSFKLLKSILNFPEGREYSYFADKIEDSAQFKSLKKSNNKLNSIVNDARNKIQHRDEEILKGVIIEESAGKIQWHYHYPEEKYYKQYIYNRDSLVKGSSSKLILNGTESDEIIPTENLKVVDYIFKNGSDIKKISLSKLFLGSIHNLEIIKPCLDQFYLEFQQKKGNLLGSTIFSFEVKYEK